MKEALVFRRGFLDRSVSGVDLRNNVSPWRMSYAMSAARRCSSHVGHATPGTLFKAFEHWTGSAMGADRCELTA